LNEGLVEQRAIAKQKVFKRGATILLREAEALKSEQIEGVRTKRCVTDPNEVIMEEFDGFKFEFPAGSFQRVMS